MQMIEPSRPSDSSNQKFITIRISRTVALSVAGVAVVAVAFLLGALYGRNARNEQKTSVQATVVAPPDTTQAPATQAVSRKPVDDSGWHKFTQDTRPSFQSEPAEQPAAYDNDPSPRAAPEEAATEEPRFAEPAPALYVPVITRRESPDLSLSMEPERNYEPAPDTPAPANRNESAAPTARGTIPATLLGAGATFPNPIYQRWFSEFHRLHPEVTINYQSIGSGGGIREVASGTVDFGATDGPMTDEQLEQARTPIVHIPTVLNAIAVIYNIPGVTGELKFTPQALAGIFLGRITSWNDPAIASVNPGLLLPNQRITVVHRSDASGPTFIFSDYLSKVSPDWQASVGKGTAVSWPLGLAGKGCEGVAGTVLSTEGSIGYVEFIYALSNKLSIGSVQNSSGVFVKPSLEATTAAAASIKDMPADFRISITNAPGKNAYPIASFTWLLIPKLSRDQARAKDMVAFLDWMLYRGESMTAVLGYAPLPANVARQVKQKIRDLR